MNFRRLDLRLILLGLIIFLAGFGLAWAVSAWVAPEARTSDSSRTRHRKHCFLADQRMT